MNLSKLFKLAKLLEKRSIEPGDPGYWNKEKGEYVDPNETNLWDEDNPPPTQPAPETVRIGPSDSDIQNSFETEWEKAREASMEAWDKLEPILWPLLEKNPNGEKIYNLIQALEAASYDQGVAVGGSREAKK